MIDQTMTTETPIEIVLRARQAGIRLRIDADGEIVAKLPADLTDVPQWLRAAKRADEQALGFAVAVVAGVERGGGDPEHLRHVNELVVRGIQ